MRALILSVFISFSGGLSADLPLLSFDGSQLPGTATPIQLPEYWASTISGPDFEWWSGTFNLPAGPTIEEQRFAEQMRIIEENLDRLLEDLKESGPPAWLIEMPEERRSRFENGAIYAEWARTDPTSASAWLAAVPEPSNYPLILGIASFVALATLRKRNLR